MSLTVAQRAILPWHATTITARKRALDLLVAACIVALFVAEFYNCVFCCDHDFLWHRNFGLSFLNDQVYVETGYHYLPARAMFDAATAWMPYRVDRAIWFLAMCAAVVYCIRFWSLAVKPTSEKWLGPALLAFLVAVSYIHRDLAECGLQIFFLPYLLWKRQVKAAVWMLATTCCISLLPGVYLGFQKNLELHAQWLRTTAERLAIEDPSENGIERPALWNRSLPLALARLVQKYPPEHPLYVPSPGDLRIATLQPRAAKRFVQISLLGLAALLAWRFRHRADTAQGSSSLAGEWSMVSILVAELSPLCWLHHLVLALPAMMMFAQTAAAGRAYRWQWILAGVSAALMLLVHRGLLNESVWSIVSAAHPHTVACLLAGAVAMSPGRTAPKEAVAFAQVPQGTFAAA
jgi:hypothetical protein